MEYKNISEKIIELQNADLRLRNKLIAKGELGDGYNEEMANLHNRNANELDIIISKIGYPTIEKVGTEASDSAWLLIQHAIGKPDFMKKCAKLLDKAVQENKADAKHLAYLTDRIAVFENKPQTYGTQFGWDENGQLSPNLYEDLNKVNQKRKSIGLNTLQEQTKIIRLQAEQENHKAPQDLKYWKKEMENWKKSVGWTK